MQGIRIPVRVPRTAVRSWRNPQFGFWIMLVLLFAAGCTAVAPATQSQTPATDTGMVSGEGSPVTALAASPDGEWLAAGHANGVIDLWSMEAMRSSAVLDGHAAAVQGLAFSADGAWLASFGEDKRTLLWNVADGNNKLLEDSLTRPNTVDFSPDGLQVAVAHWEKLSIWQTDAQDADPRVIPDLEPSISHAYFTPAGDRIAVALSNTGMARSAVLLLDVVSGAQVGSLAVGGPPQELRFNVDGSLMAVATKEGVEVWSPTGTRAWQVAGAVDALVFDAEGALLGLRMDEETVFAWDARSGELRSTSRAVAPEQALTRFAPDGSALYAGLADGTVIAVELPPAE